MLMFGFSGRLCGCDRGLEHAVPGLEPRPSPRVNCRFRFCPFSQLISFVPLFLILGQNNILTPPPVY